MVQGKITEADTLTICLDAAPFGLSVPPPPSSLPFLCHRMPFLSQPSQFILAWERRLMMLACIPGDLVSVKPNVCAGKCRTRKRRIIAIILTVLLMFPHNECGMQHISWVNVTLSFLLSPKLIFTLFSMNYFYTLRYWLGWSMACDWWDKGAVHFTMTGHNRFHHTV